MKRIAKQLIGSTHRHSILFLVASAILFPGSGAYAVVTAGGLAVIGYNDDPYNSSFTVAALEPIAAGEVVYFTNNGWSSSRGMFNGADVDQGSGAESIIKLTATNAIAKGTVFSSSASGANYTWDKTSTITGTTNGTSTFSDLYLDYTSDQIYAFQALADNPLLNPTNFIFALHFGDAVFHPTFSDAVDTMSGDIPPGLSLIEGTAVISNVAYHGSADGSNSAWGLDVNSPQIALIQATGGHKDQWLTLLSNSSNWGQGTPTTTHLSVAPEPSRTLLACFGIGLALLRRRRTAE